MDGLYKMPQNKHVMVLCTISLDLEVYENHSALRQKFEPSIEILGLGDLSLRPNKKEGIGGTLPNKEALPHHSL